MRPTWRSEEYYESGWGYQITPAVKWLLLLNLGCFIGQSVAGIFKQDHVVSYWMALSWEGMSTYKFWQLGSYMFLHGGVWHLLMNMLGLFFFGNEVESTVGTRRFLRIYLLGGLVGGGCWVVGDFSGYLVGASGSVYAVVTAFATLYPNRPVTLLLFFVLPMTILAKYLAVGFLFVSMLMMLGEAGGVAHIAHIGGMMVGYAYIRCMGMPLSWPFSRKTSPVLRSVSNRTSRPHPISSIVKRDEFIQQKIDPILDKIAQHGIHSLTRDERRILDEAKDRL